MKKVDANNTQSSLMPTPCLSPTGNKPDCKEIPEASEKAKGSAVGQLRASNSKKSLKKISRENSTPATETSVSEFTLELNDFHGLNRDAATHFQPILFIYYTFFAPVEKK